MSEERDRLGYYQRNPPTPEWAARISAMYDSAVARAEAAEARVKELKADGHATGCDGESADDCACGFKRRSLLAENAALRMEVARFRDEVVPQVEKKRHDAMAENAALRAEVEAALDEMPYSILPHDKRIVRRLRAALASGESREDCPCGDQTRPGHPAGRCEQFKPAKIFVCPECGLRWLDGRRDCRHIVKAGDPAELPPASAGPAEEVKP